MDVARVVIEVSVMIEKSTVLGREKKKMFVVIRLSKGAATSNKRICFRGILEGKSLGYFIYVSASSMLFDLFPDIFHVGVCFMGRGKPDRGNDM